jgi:hypothetical protein
MKKLFTKLSALLLFVWPGIMAAQQQEDIQAIKSLCGCFKVQFNFAETFSPDTSYVYKDRYTAAATEYIFTDEEAPDKLVLQHLLILSEDAVIKHWRQDWVFQETRLFEYAGNRSWTFATKSVHQTKGAWAQKVFEVNDAPRYSAPAVWVHSAEFPYWESTSNAPLPRREYTKRSDYQILRRTNKHALYANGHIHDQDNQKLIVRADGSTELLVNEKGYVTYQRTNDVECQSAIDWWEKKKTFWRISRAVWDEKLAQGQEIEMAFKVDGKMYHEALAAFQESAPTDEVQLRKELGILIDKYLSVIGKL